MLTPNFNISQTAKQIILVIKAPMANLRETELIAEDEVVIFSAPPYYLRLHLSGKLREIEQTCGKFDSDRGEFTFTLDKEEEGEDFKDLDLLGKLLIPKKKHTLRPEISCIEENATDESDKEDEDPDAWLYEQSLRKEEPQQPCFPSYGFANNKKGNEQELREEFNEILDVPEAGSVQSYERRQRRIQIENDQFSEDHYLADLMEPEVLQDYIDYVPPWYSNEKVTLCQEDKNYLKELGNRDYLLDVYETKSALLSLIDILYAYAYNYRTTLGEERNVESAWTVNKLSSTLSCFETFQDASDVKTAFVRRSLIYPLYRNWVLSNKVLDDTLAILKQGKRSILKCFIEIHKMFNESEPRYLLNQLYITDYCIWIQKVSDSKIKHMATYFSQTNPCKHEVGLDLFELEAAALSVKQEDDIEHCVGLIKSVGLNEPVSSDDSEPDSSSSSERSSSSSFLECSSSD